MLNRREFHRICSGFAASVAAAQDWPQWRGPNRDGAATGSGPAQWPEKLRQVWKTPVGEGHSSPVVAGKRVFQFARRGDSEVISAHDLDSGKEIWKQAYATPYEMHPAARSHGKGPKSTPLVQDGRVYTLGMTGVLSCLSADSGKVVWQYQSSGKFKGTSPLYGVAMSPAIYDGLLIAHVGTDADGALTAYDPASGTIRWQWKGNGPAYSSPVLARGQQIVTFSAEKLIGVSLKDGSLLWEMPFTTPYSQNAVTPFVHGDLVIYSGLSQPVTAIRIAGGKPQKVWENKEVGMYMNSPVLAAGLLHGLSHRNKGQYFSLDPATGKTVWTSEGRQTENAMLVARSAEVFSLTTDSELHVMRATGRGLEPLRKYTVADSPTWAHPVVMGSRVVVKDLDSLALWTA